VCVGASSLPVLKKRRLARSRMCVWVSQRQRHASATSARAPRAALRCMAMMRAVLLPPPQIVASCTAKRPSAWMGGFGMQLTCMVLVSRALKAVRRLDFFGLAVGKDTRQDFFSRPELVASKLTLSERPGKTPQQFRRNNDPRG